MVHHGIREWLRGSNDCSQLSLEAEVLCHEFLQGQQKPLAALFAARHLQERCGRCAPLEALELRPNLRRALRTVQPLKEPLVAVYEIRVLRPRSTCMHAKW